MLTPIIMACFFCFCIGFVVGWVAATTEDAHETFGTNPSVPDGIKRPNPVAIPYPPRNYCPIMPMPTPSQPPGLRHGELQTSDSQNPAPNPFVYPTGRGVK